jgi:hypothetical protein
MQFVENRGASFPDAACVEHQSDKEQPGLKRWFRLHPIEFSFGQARLRWLLVSGER